MYKAFYKLTRSPFEITPDPSFLFCTNAHNEALATLYYGVRRQKGFVVMTGEVGTGKTLLVRCLLQLLNRANVGSAYVYNTRLTALEFLQYIVGDLGLSASGKSKSELLLQLNGYLIDRHHKALTTVLVVDEAHHLSVDVLEEIRLLTNLETAQNKLLQILLVGQPELDEKLDSFELRQLKQRIALRCHLQALNQDETKGYIHRRLQLAGANSHTDTIFSGDAITEVYRHSRGIPRLINTICENALISAYAKRTALVMPDTIDEVASDLRLHIMHAVPAEPTIAQNNELWMAVKTLLESHESLKLVRPTKGGVGMAMPSGASKHEPII